ncbi:DUF1206 domain-containing protein [Maribacter sp. ACAM166]|nr:DUF1206 domain-containing protein [Maribacter sp. ACAM166]
MAKGITYAPTGILTLLSAINIGGQKAGRLAVIDYLKNHTCGTVLIFILGIGLICFAILRFMVSIKDLKGIGLDIKGLAKRSYFLRSLRDSIHFSWVWYFIIAQK